MFLDEKRNKQDGTYFMVFYNNDFQVINYLSLTKNIDIKIQTDAYIVNIVVKQYVNRNMKVWKTVYPVC